MNKQTKFILDVADDAAGFLIASGGDYQRARRSALKLIMNFTERKKELISFLENQRPDFKKSWAELAKKFELETGEVARHAWRKHNKQRSFSEIENAPIRHYKFPESNMSGPKIVLAPETQLTEYVEDFKTGKATLSMKSANDLKTFDDVKKLVDTDKWEIVKYGQSYWSGKYQIELQLEPKKINESEVLEKLVNNYKSDWKPLQDKDLKINGSWEEPSLVVINLNDLHFDKLDLDNSTIDKRIEDYKKVLLNLIFKAYACSQVDEIVFVLGNDMFNTDNIQNNTTAGTPQSVNCTWDVAYEKVFDAMVKSISTLKQFCNKLNIILVQGNHDRTKSYYLAHALETYFKNDTSIVFDRTSAMKKVFIYGETFLGFNHGNNVNDKLPLAFSTEFYKEWGQCKYHDILISDKHHNNEKIFKSNQTQNEFQGVKVRILPSLSGTDKWHNDNLYRSRQSGICLVYDKTRGKQAEFEFQL